MNFRIGEEQIYILDHKYKQWHYILGWKCQYLQLFIYLTTRISFTLVSNNEER